MLKCQSDAERGKKEKEMRAKKFKETKMNDKGEWHSERVKV